MLWLDYKKWATDCFNNMKEKIEIEETNEDMIEYTYQNKNYSLQINHNHTSKVKNRINKDVIVVEFLNEGETEEIHLIVKLDHMTIDFFTSIEGRRLNIMILNNNGNIGYPELFIATFDKERKKEIKKITKEFIQYLSDLKEFRLFVITGSKIEEPDYL